MLSLEGAKYAVLRFACSRSASPPLFKLSTGKSNEICAVAWIWMLGGALRSRRRQCWREFTGERTAVVPR